MGRKRDEEEFDEEEGDSDFEGDEEDELEEEDDEQEKQQRKQPSKKRKGAEFFDEAAEEDDDEDEDEGGGGRKRKKASRFIDDIADVDDEEEEEEADEDVDDMLQHDEELDADELGGGGAAARYRELDMRRGGRDERTEEEMAKYLEEKYKDDVYDDDDDYGHYGEEEDVGQQGLQPTKEDPGLFIVTCRIGAEREACLQLLQKCYDLAERGTPLQIKSAVCLDHLKGFFYVEAFRDSHVVEAVRGLRTIYAGKGARLVPLKERAAAITVNRQAKAAIERDSWVRVRGGLYKDDLGKVVDVDFAAGRALIKLVPRLDLAAMAKDHMSGGGRRNPFGRQAVRPPPKPFRAKEAGELGLPVGKDRNDPAVITMNTHRFLDGYTLRNYTLKGLILQDTAPPLDEISRFNQAGQSEFEDSADPTAHLQQLLKSMPDGAAPKATFVKGDRVVVTAGDLATLEGTVEDVRKEDGKLLVRPDILADQLVEMEVTEVQKLFKAGDHVRVLSGPHAGERGMVVAVNEGMCVLLPDSRQGELRVFAKDLTEAVESGTGIETLGGKYELHDLVQLDANTAGVIIAIEKEVARVLTNNSTPTQPDVRICRESDILRKLQTNRTSAQDANNAVINTGDNVVYNEAGAGSKGQLAVRKEKGGTVHAISRGSLFIKTADSNKSGGFMVVGSKQVRLRGSKAQMPVAPGVGFGGAALQNTPKGTPGSTPQHGFGSIDGGGRIGSYGGYGGGGRGSGRGRGHGNGLIGTEVVVRQGAYARYKGRIKQETATHLQMELDAINKTVMVKKQDVFGTGPGAGPMGHMGPGRGGFNPGRGGGFNPGGFNPGGFNAPPRTPAHVMQTPMHPSQGGATPMHPSRTPLHPSQTPLHPSMTPLHPSMTPMHPGMTPRHPSGEPDWGVGPTAATPGGYGAPPAAAATPGNMGGYGTAPTPGTAETPGAAGYADPGNARTPGAVAATPGGQDAYGQTAYTPGGYMSAPDTNGGQDMIAPSPAADSYYAQPTPGMGHTPGTVATPGMVTGYTPMGNTPAVAFTPGLDGGAGGVPSTPGLGVMPGLDSLGNAAGPGQPQQQQPKRPDYCNVLLKLPDGRIGVGGETRPDGSVEATVLGNGEKFVLDTVELVPVEKKDKVKVVAGEKQGKEGVVMTFDGGDAVLMDADVVDRTYLGKLHVGEGQGES